jgi:PPK2 family polyphosphate:nucleotide phosphotransferase
VDYGKELIVKPGATVKLHHIDPSNHGAHENHEKALPEIQKALQRMSELQYLMYAERKHALLIVLQGIDAAGKDGVCRHVIEGMNPQGCSVVAFKQPTQEELEHDFLWRVHRLTPRHGQVVVFNRSHYEDVLVARVHKLVPKEIWSARYDLINDFEKLLAAANTTIIKFFLYISKEEQLERFKARLEDPARQWKISDSDYQEREYWDDYVAAYDNMLEKCSAKHAPWYVIPSNHKWFRNLAVSQIICETMEGIGMRMPKPTVDLARIRKEYHEARAEQTKDEKKATK